MNESEKYCTEENGAMNPRSSLLEYAGLVSDYVNADLEYEQGDDDDMDKFETRAHYAILVANQVAKNPPTDAGHKLNNMIDFYVRLRDTRNLTYAIKLPRVIGAARDVADAIVARYFIVDEKNRRVKLILADNLVDIQ